MLDLACKPAETISGHAQEFWVVFWRRNCYIIFLVKRLKFDSNVTQVCLFSNGLIDNKLELIQAIAWRLTDNKPLIEPILTNTPDAIWRHYATMS